MTKQCKVLKVIRPRPNNVPSHWEIYNAPRPLWGAKEWQGDFICGVFYAGVDPDDERADIHRKENASLHANLLIFVTEAEAIEEALEYYRAKGLTRITNKIDLTDKDHRGMLIDGWVERQRDNAR